jgi:hypothetical protein
MGGTASCMNGTCSIQCTPGLTACGDKCVDTQSDLANCGGCGMACATTQANSHAMCSEGMCKTQCNWGFVACDAYCISIALIQDQRAFALCAVLAASQDNK